jgi:hypothetical protein
MLHGLFEIVTCVWFLAILIIVRWHYVLLSGNCSNSDEVPTARTPTAQTIENVQPSLFASRNTHPASKGAFRRQKGANRAVENYS